MKITLIDGVLHELGAESGDLQRWDRVTIDRVNERLAHRDELLAALKDALVALESYGTQAAPDRDAVLAAIAKAEGGAS